MPQPEPVDLVCPKCLSEITVVMPIMPRYTLEEALTMMPITSLNHLYVLIHRNRHSLDTPHYVKGKRGRRHRLLSAADIRKLNDLLRPTLRSFIAMLKRAG